MSCHAVVELVTDYLEGFLHRDDAAEFEEHVVACGGCGAYYRRMRKTIRLLASLGGRGAEPAPPAAGNGAEPAVPGEVERYYKFTLPGGVGPFSGVQWPQPVGSAPGGWVEATGELHPCAIGVHACRAEHLPFWIGPELWMVELNGDVTVEGHKVFARRGRLLERVAAWDREVAKRFGEAWARRTRDLAIEILRSEGSERDAERLAGCEDLGAVVDLETRLDSKDGPGWKAYLYAQTAAELSADAAGAGATEAAAAAAAHAAGSEDAAEEVYRRHAAEMCEALGLSGARPTRVA